MTTSDGPWTRSPAGWTAVVGVPGDPEWMLDQLLTAEQALPAPTLDVFATIVDGIVVYCSDTEACG